MKLHYNLSRCQVFSFRKLKSNGNIPLHPVSSSSNGQSKIPSQSLLESMRLRQVHWISSEAPGQSTRPSQICSAKIFLSGDPGHGSVGSSTSIATESFSSSTLFFLTVVLIVSVVESTVVGSVVVDDWLFVVV